MEDSDDIVGIDGCRKNKEGEWELKYIIKEVRKGKEKEISGWAALNVLFEDCQKYVDDGLERINFIYSAAKSKQGDCPRGLQLAIAKLMGINEVIVFFPVEGHEGTTFSRPKKDPPPAPLAIIECSHGEGQSFDSSGYTQVFNAFYFKDGKKWHGLPCSKCSKVFGEGTGEIRPTFAAPAYGCTNFVLEKSICKEMLCSECYKTSCLNSPATTKRASRRKA